MFGWFGKSKALKQYKTQLVSQLRRDYGKAEGLNADQIRASVKRAKLDEQYVMYAYAIFMMRSDFENEFSGSEEYDGLLSDLGGNKPYADASYYAQNTEQFADNGSSIGNGFGGDGGSGGGE